MLETSKQALLFNVGEDLSYSVILRYKLRDLIKIYDFVNDLIKGGFSENFITISDWHEKFGGIKWLWLHTAHKSFLGLFFNDR